MDTSPASIPLPLDRELAALRARYPSHRIMRTPWGWSAYQGGDENDVQAPTLKELGAQLAQIP